MREKNAPTQHVGFPTWLTAALVALCAAAVYLHTLAHGFAFDDVSEVVRNAYIRSLANVPRMFASGAWEGAGEKNAIYRPLTTLTYALNYALGGLSPFGYHLVNLLGHAAVSCTALALALRLGLARRFAVLAALLFAVHPVHVEVVANVAGRKDVLAALFAVAAVLAHVRARRAGGPASPALAVASVAAALFSKESGVAALGMVVLWDLLFEPDAWGKGRGRTLALYGAYLAAFVGYLCARRLTVGSFGVPLDLIPYVENPAAHASVGVRLLTAVAVLGRGLGLLVAPVLLSPDYSYNAIPLVSSPLDPGFLGGLLGLAFAATLAVLCRKRAPALTFAAGVYFLSVFPASNLLIPVGTIFGERLLYLPSLGFCLAAAFAAERLWRAGGGELVNGVKWALAAVAVVVLVLFSVRTVTYAALWSDELSLFRAAAGAQPKSGKAHELLGAALMEEGKAVEGVRELEIGTAIQRTAPDPPLGQFIELGVGYERLGRWADAANVYAWVLQREPSFPDALWRLGVVAWAQGRREEAVQLWERTVSVAPAHARALSDLGLAAYAAGDLGRAEALWLRALGVDPRTPGPWLRLGELYLRRGEVARAREAWLRFLDNARYGAYPRERVQVEERLRQLDARLGRSGEAR